MPTRGQLALIHAARRELERSVGLSEESYRDILRMHGGVESSKHLTREGLRAVLEQFQALGWSSPKVRQPRRRGAWHGGLITPPQQSKIRALMEVLGWDEAGMIGFSRRMTRKAWPQTSEEASKIIEALKKMVERRETEPPRASG